MFEELNSVTLLAFSGQNMGNSLGSVLYFASLNRNYELFSSISISYPSVPVSSDIRYAVFDLNQPILITLFQFLVIIVLSLCLSSYVRGYLFSKRNFRRHFAFRNIIEFGLEYVF